MRSTPDEGCPARDPDWRRNRITEPALERATDVIFLTEEALSNEVATGNVEDLTGLIEAAGTDLSEFDQVDCWQVDGATYGIPVYSQLVMMDYTRSGLPVHRVVHRS